MKQILVDTNVVLSVLIDREEEQQAEASQLFAEAAAGDLELILHQVVLTEMVYVLGNHYDTPAREISPILEDLLAAPGVRPMNEIPWAHLLGLWPDPYAHFGDAVLAVSAASQRYDGIATFDKKFRRTLAREGLPLHWPA